MPILTELLRELVEEGGFHEEDLVFANISLTIICTADNITRLHPRLEALFATHHLPYPSLENMMLIMELRLRISLKGKKDLIESWITKMMPAISEAIRSMECLQESSATYSAKDVTLWADSLKYYPIPENEADITRYLLDSGQRLFCSRFDIY
ncbi:hypothetical protein KM043_004787 [Ampulex compressa]|nr:hypothetical protein KM043_004787 [Ampulex compressa]